MSDFIHAWEMVDSLVEPHSSEIVLVKRSVHPFYVPSPATQCRNVPFQKFLSHLLYNSISAVLSVENDFIVVSRISGLVYYYCIFCLDWKGFVLP